MSAPFHDDERREDSLRYAPKWARTTPPGAPMNLSEISAAIADGKPVTFDPDAPPPLPAKEAADTPSVVRKPAETHRIASPPRASSRYASQAFEGDAAVKKLRMRQSIEPQMLPEPPVSESRASGLTMIIRLSAAIGVAAAAALAVVYVVPIQRGTDLPATRVPVASGEAQPAKRPVTSARLVVEDRRGGAGQSLPLGVHLVGVAGSSEVYMSGLAVGARLSAGAAVGPTGWRIPARSLDGATVTPPKDFVGAMEVAVDLHDAEDRVMDSSMVRLEWAAPARPEPQPAIAAAPQAPALAAAAAQAPAPAASVVQTPARVANAAPAAAPQATPRAPAAAVVATAPPAPPRPQLSADEIAMLLGRSDEFLAAGDISTARVLLRRAAETGHARAALALATTYDPIALKQLGLVGVMPDVALALSWYEKAAEFGSTDAAKRAELLATQATTGPAR